MDKYTYINSSFIKKDQAFVSVSDRAFRFGDGIFETIRVRKSSIYQWKLHEHRIISGLSALKIDFNHEGILDSIIEIISKNSLVDGFVRIMISRGEGSIGYLPVTDIKPSLIIETISGYPNIPTEKNIWLSSYKKISSSMLPVECKTMQGLNSILAKIEANDNNCFEALQLTASNNIAECSSGNIFWIKNSKLFTPSLECGVLRGVMRQRVLDLTDIEIEEGIYSIESILDADSVFITNVAVCVLPITRIIPYNKIFNTEDKNTIDIQKKIQKDLQSNG